MSIQTDLLKTILTQLQDNVMIGEEQLTALYNYLFDPDGINITFEDQELQESVEFLKDIIQTDQLTTLQQVLDYFEEEKSAMEDYAAIIVAQNNNEDVWNSFNKSIFISYSRDDNNNHDLRSAIEKFLSTTNREFFAPMTMVGSYAKPIKTYLNQFTEHIEDKIIFILHGALHREIEARKISDVYWKVNHVNLIMPSCIYRNPLLDLVFTTNYDELLDKISNETPLYDMSIKVGLTTLFVCTKIHFNNPCDIDLPIYLSKRRKEPEDFCDLDRLRSWLENFYSETLANKKWAILKSPTGYSWLTSDNPGFVIERNENGIGHIESEDIWDRLRSRNARFYYPLSKDYCLRIDNGDNLKGREAYIDFEESSNEEWDEVNSNTFQTSREMVISSERNLLERFKQ